MRALPLLGLLAGCSATEITPAALRDSGAAEQHITWQRAAGASALAPRAA